MNDENMNNGEVISHHTYNRLGLIPIDEQGREVWTSTFFEELLEDSLDFSLIPHDIAHGLLDFETVYKWSNLEQSGYKIKVELVPHSIFGDRLGEGLHINQAMKWNDIKIRFGDKTESLFSYLNNKKSDISLYVIGSMISRGIRREEINHGIGSVLIYEAVSKHNLDSETISQILSSGGKSVWDSYPKKLIVTDGHKNIFESDELLDQLAVTLLINIARAGYDNALYILMALLHNKIVDFLKFKFKDLDKADFQDLISQTTEFIGGVIKNEQTFPTRFKFPQTNKSSLVYWLLGNGRWVEKRSGFIPKLQEFLADKYVPTIKKEKMVVGSLDAIPESDTDSHTTESSLLREIDQKDEEYWTDKHIKESQFRDLRKQLAKLPERSQRILEMYSEGFKLEEIGEQYGIKKSAVSKIISKNLNELRVAP